MYDENQEDYDEEDEEISTKELVLRSLYNKLQRALIDGELRLMSYLINTTEKVLKLPNEDALLNPTERMKRRRAERDQLMAQLLEKFKRMKEG